MKPSEKDIWLVLEEKDYTAAESVAKWLTTAEGQRWISDNSDRILRNCEDCQWDYIIPSEEMLAKIHEAIRRRKIRRIALAAASFLLPVMVIATMWININNKVGNILFRNPETVCETSVLGERKTVVFQDGTKVYLNAGSKLSYPSFWGLKSRDVKLDGEGFFDVVKNPRRPLTVNINGASLAVYGTRFNVKAYDLEDLIEVLLFDGSVDFETEDKTYHLQPSEQLTFNRVTEKVDIISLKHTDDEVLWTKNIIMFRNKPLKNIAEVLSRWYNVTFEIEDESLNDRKFTLKTAHQPLQTLLDEMEYVSDIDFELEGEKVKVRKKKN